MAQISPFKNTSLQFREGCLKARSFSWSCSAPLHEKVGVMYILLYGGFLKWWVCPTTIGFPTKSDHFGVFWGYRAMEYPHVRWEIHRLNPGSFSSYVSLPECSLHSTKLFLFGKYSLKANHSPNPLGNVIPYLMTTTLPSERLAARMNGSKGPGKSYRRHGNVWKNTVSSHVYQEVKPKDLKHHGSFEMPDIFVFDGHAPFLTTVSAWQVNGSPEFLNEDAGQ